MISYLLLSHCLSAIALLCFGEYSAIALLLMNLLMNFFFFSPLRGTGIGMVYPLTITAFTFSLSCFTPASTTILSSPTSRTISFRSSFCRHVFSPITKKSTL